MDFSSSNKAIFLQVADALCDDIVKGVYPPGQRVPSVREYAATTGVNCNTVVRSYEHLSDRGIIYNRRGIGFFASDDADTLIRRQRLEVFNTKEKPRIFAHLHNLGIAPETFYEEYKSYIDTL